MERMSEEIEKLREEIRELRKENEYINKLVNEKMKQITLEQRRTNYWARQFMIAKEELEGIE